MFDGGAVWTVGAGIFAWVDCSVVFCRFGGVCCLLFELFVQLIFFFLLRVELVPVFFATFVANFCCANFCNLFDCLLTIFCWMQL